MDLITILAKTGSTSANLTPGFDENVRQVFRIIYANDSICFQNESKLVGQTTEETTRKTSPSSPETSPTSDGQKYECSTTVETKETTDMTSLLKHSDQQSVA